MYGHLEEDLSGHGEAVGDVGLFIWGLALPAVELQTPAAREQALAVHLWGGHARELAGWRGSSTSSRHDVYISPHGCECGWKRLCVAMS